MKKKISIGMACMLILLTIVATFNITYWISWEKMNARLVHFQELEEEFSKFKSIKNYIDNYFVGEYDENAMMDQAMKGYVSGMGDRWSTYLNAEEYEEYKSEDSYVGIGVVAQYDAEKNTMIILEVYENSPASEAGLLPLDNIIAINGEDISSMNYTMAQEKIMGDEGTVVRLKIMRETENAPIDIRVERRQVHTEAVSSRIVDGNIGYVRIRSFSENSDKEFTSALGKLTSAGVEGLVFDVRSNPGGNLMALVNMLDALLPKGNIISMKDKDENGKTYTSDDEEVTLPMAVIVNEYSYSAAEFFAAALQEYEKAQIVGKQTVGKGYAQDPIELDDGSALFLSTYKYYTPNGRNLQGVGITPDHIVDKGDGAATNGIEDPQYDKAFEIVKADVETVKAAQAAAEAAVQTEQQTEEKAS